MLSHPNSSNYIDFAFKYLEKLHEKALKDPEIVEIILPFLMKRIEKMLYAADFSSGYSHNSNFEILENSPVEKGVLRTTSGTVLREHALIPKIVEEARRTKDVVLENFVIAYGLDGLKIT